MHNLQQTTLDRNSSIPLYLQLYDVLRQHLEQTPPSDGRIPREKDLCQLFDVSHHTVQQAIQMLVDEKQLVRIKRRGTFMTSKLSCFDYQHPSRKIGLLLPQEPTWEYFAQQIRKDVIEANFSFVCASYQWNDPISEGQALKRSLANCAGVIFYPHNLAIDDTLKKQLAPYENRPLVLFDFYPQEYLYDFVSTDHMLGSRLMMEQLAQQAIGTCLLLDDGSDDFSVQLRIIGCTFGARQFDLPAPILEHMPDISAPERLTELILDRKIQSVFFLNFPSKAFQRLLCKSWQALKSAGFPQPSIVSWDDLRSFKLPNYSGFLYQQRYELGHAAFSLLFDKLRHPGNAKQRTLLMPALHFLTTPGTDRI